MGRILPWLRDGREDRALLLLPTYGQVLHLRRHILLEFDDLEGIFESPLVTFSSLAERVVDHPLRRMISAAEKDLVLRHVLASGRGAFDPVKRYAGFRSVCLEVLKEIKENGLPLTDVTDVLRARGDIGGDATRERLVGLADVLVRYQRILDEKGLVDHEDLLIRLRDRLRDDPAELAGIEAVAVDGFTDFTRVEEEILESLSQRSAHTWVSLSGRLGGARDGLFSSTEQTAKGLLGRGYSLEELHDVHRFDRPALGTLEASLFDADAEPAARGDAVEILAGTDLEDEVDRLARRALRLVRDDGYRPHEIGVIVRDWAGYSDLLPEAFARHGLPLTVHAGRPLEAAPIVRGVLGVLRIIADDWQGEDVREVLLTGVLGAEPDAIDAVLRAWTRGRAPDGCDGWLSAAGEHPEVREALEAVAAEADALGQAETIGDQAERVRGWWGGLLRMEDPDGADDEESLARATAQADALRSLSGVLDDVVRGLKTVDETAADLDRFARAVRDAVDHATVRTRSRRFETVHAVSVEEARQWQLRAVLVPGLLEGTFPRKPREDIFLRDREREELNREGRLRLKERLRTGDEERYLFYVAVTRASEKLVLSYPIADAGGSPLLRSFFVGDVRRVFPDLEPDESPLALPPAEVAPTARETTGRADLRRHALLVLGEPRTEDSDHAVSVASTLNDALTAEDPPYRRHMAVGLRFLTPPEAKLVICASVEDVAHRRQTFSASSLTAFAWCPFKDFSGNTLRLNSPEDDAIDRRDLGTVAHAALRAVLADGCDPGEAFTAAVAEHLGARDTSLWIDRGLRDLREYVVALAARERARLAAGGLTAVALETFFGGEGSEFTMGDVPIRGVLDRVDIDAHGRAAVIDYKLKVHDSSKKIVEAIAAGQAFQLPVYMAAVRQVMGHDPAAAFLLAIEGDAARGIAREGASDTGLAPDEGLAVLSADEIEELISKTSDAVASVAERVRSGEIRVEPEETTYCARGKCAFVDLCRVEPWVIEAKRAAAEDEA
jgi:ATP-dependent helicase/nuclease subunit B